MIVAEMIRRLRVSLNDITEPYQISTDQLYLLLQGAYMGIQRESTQWRFFHERGILITTVADQEEYTTSSIGYINPDSIYAIETGSEQRIPLCLKHYQDWVYEETSGVVNQGQPLYIIHTPAFTWKLDPIPTSIWVIYADYWFTPSEFTGQEDEPIWDEEYHEIVLLEAMKTVSALKPDSKEAILMLAQVASLLPGLRNAFAIRYLPSVRGARPML